jgi:uncharacterized glyoxalase superfamily protein PhnB
MATRSPCTTAMRTRTPEGMDGAWAATAPVGPESLAWVPGMVSGRFFETWDFYTTCLGFRTLAESNTYVHLRHPSGAQLAVLREETEGAPAELVSATRGRGFWLFLEVDDAATLHQALHEGGVVAAVPLRDTAWGDRQFAVRDPNGVLIYIVQRKVDARAAAEVGGCLAAVGAPVAL